MLLFTTQCYDIFWRGVNVAGICLSARPVTVVLLWRWRRRWGVTTAIPTAGFSLFVCLVHGMWRWINDIGKQGFVVLGHVGRSSGCIMRLNKTIGYQLHEIFFGFVIVLVLWKIFVHFFTAVARHVIVFVVANAAVVVLVFWAHVGYPFIDRRLFASSQ